MPVVASKPVRDGRERRNQYNWPDNRIDLTSQEHHIRQRLDFGGEFRWLRGRGRARVVRVRPERNDASDVGISPMPPSGPGGRLTP